MRYIIVIVALFVVVLQSEGKKFTRCELVHELRKHGFPEDKMRDWVCLVEHESSRITDKIGSINKNGSRDYGLFQVNDKYWCSNTDSPGKDCHVRCEDLLSDDITRIVACTKKIYKRHRFTAWHGWQKHCQGALPDISSC